jgi:hypothetical protein
MIIRKGQKGRHEAGGRKARRQEAREPERQRGREGEEGRGVKKAHNH